MLAWCVTHITNPFFTLPSAINSLMDVSHALAFLSYGHLFRRACCVCVFGYGADQTNGGHHSNGLCARDSDVATETGGGGARTGRRTGPSRDGRGRSGSPKNHRSTATTAITISITASATTAANATATARFQSTTRQEDARRRWTAADHFVRPHQRVDAERALGRRRPTGWPGNR